MEKEGFVRKILEGKQKGDMDERWPALNVILLAIQYPQCWLVGYWFRVYLYVYSLAWVPRFAALEA